MAILNLAGDAADIDPADFAARLTDAVRTRAPVIDDYARGGAVAVFEERIAAALGKERAILFATGTLANLLAIRTHAAKRGCRRVVVQAEGHIANDAGDCAGELAGLTLVPLAHADFTAAALQAEIARAASSRVAAGIAAVVVESPLRRGLGATVPLEHQADIVTLARDNNIATHLDGARLYIASGFLDRPVGELAAPYDTVYVSLYKYFGVPFGAVLAGPASLIDGLYHDRRRFGGGLNQMWPVAVVADLALDGLEAEWRAIAARARRAIDRLAGLGVPVREAPFGTNVFQIRPPHPDGIADRARRAGVKLPPEAAGMFPAKANATWIAEPEDVLVERLSAVFSA